MTKTGPVRYSTGELPNGLKTVAAFVPGSEVVELRVYVRAGSVYEEEFCGSGISHFTEHVAAEGPTKHKSKKKVRKLIEDFGNAFNAYTCKDHTAYHITTTKEHFDKALKLLAELVFENKITRSAYKREKGVIQREIEQSLQNPGSFLHRQALENLYRLHPARYPVIGKTENFKQLSYSDLVKYYHRRYVPGNALVAVGGAVPRKKAFEKIEKIFSKYKKRNYTIVSLPAETGITSVRSRKVYRDIQGSYLMLSWLSVELSDNDLFALDLLSEILSGSRNSRLELIVKEEKQLVNSINSFSHTPDYGKGVFAVKARIKDSDTAAAERAILEIILDIQKNGVNKNELKKAKKLAISSNLLKKTAVSGLTSRVGVDTLTTGSADFTDTYIQRLKMLTSDEIQLVAAKYLSLSGYGRVELLPQKERKKTKKEKIIKERKPEKIQLDNGIKLIMEKVPGISVIYYSIFFKGGLSYDKCFQCPGLFTLLSSLLSRGSENYSRRQIAEEFEKRGAKFNTSSGYNTFYLTSFSLREDLNHILELISKIIYRPAFNPQEFEKERNFQLQAIAQEKNNWQSEAYLNFKRHIFPEKLPYSASINGTAEAIKKVNIGLLKRAHKIFTSPENTVISISGDFKREKLIKAVSENFSPVISKEEKIPNYPEEFISSEKKITKTYPNSKKELAVIFTGFPTVSIYDWKQRIVLDVIDTLVSGAGYPGGWLHNRLREKELVYAAGGNNINFLKSGAFMVYAATNPAKLEETKKQIETILEKLKKGNYSDKEIERAKDQILIMRRLSRQTPSARAKSYALNEIFSFGYDFEDRYAENLEKVCRQDIDKTVKKYFKNPLSVITGPGN